MPVLSTPTCRSWKPAQATPEVRSLGIDFEEALVQGARGSILPRQVRPNEDTRFTYTLWPQAGEEDSGFDLLRLAVPGQVEGVAVRVGAQEVAPRVAARGDSLLLALPEKVRDDSVQVEFTTRLFHNATVFALELGDAGRPGVWQSVEAAGRRADVVLVPELASNPRLIGDLRISSGVLTPNGDGINDQMAISLVVFKVEEAAPRVRIYDLAGGLVAELEASSAEALKEFRWAGRDLQGELVEPGIYLPEFGIRSEVNVFVDKEAHVHVTGGTPQTEVVVIRH